MVQRTVASLFFSYLFLSVCFSEPASFIGLSEVQAQLSTTPSINQLVIAALVGASSSSPSTQLSSFSGTVQAAIQGGRAASDVSQLASAITALGLVDILLRIKFVSQLSSTLNPLIQASSARFATTLTKIFDTIDQASPGSSSLLDPRTLPNLNTALTAAGAPTDTATVNVAVLINLVLIYNVAFQDLLKQLVPAHGAVSEEVANYAWLGLAKFSKDIFVTASDIVNQLGGVTPSTGVTLTKPQTSAFIKTLFPANTMSSTVLNNLNPFNGPTLPISTPGCLALQTIFTVLNIVN